LNKLLQFFGFLIDTLDVLQEVYLYFLKDIVVAIMKTSIGGIVKFYGIMFFIITTLVLFAFFLKMILGG
jgi:hypothetical protein